MTITLKQIAEQAEVSVMAVSAALNQTTWTRVSPETREKILGIATKLGYRPNVLAQTLSGGRSRMLGVIIDSGFPAAVLAILRGVEHAATQCGYRIMIAEQHESPQSIADQCDAFDQYGVEGILCLSHDYPRRRTSISRIFRNRKNILFWEEPQGIAAPYASLEAGEAFRQVLAAWRKCGRRRPAMAIDASGNQQLQLRVAAFKASARECGFEPEVVDLHALPDTDEIFPLMQTALRTQILPRGIDAVLTESDLWGVALLQAAREQGIEVPRQLAVVGWDNTVFCQGATPPLASFDIKLETLGQNLVEMFQELKQKGEVRPRAVAVEFVNRASSGIKLD